jgi:hypothetical protein
VRSIQLIGKDSAIASALYGLVGAVSVRASADSIARIQVLAAVSNAMESLRSGPEAGSSSPQRISAMTRAVPMSRISRRCASAATYAMTGPCIIAMHGSAEQ